MKGLDNILVLAELALTNAPINECSCLLLLAHVKVALQSLLSYLIVKRHQGNKSLFTQLILLLFLRAGLVHFEVFNHVTLLLVPHLPQNAQANTIHAKYSLTLELNLDDFGDHLKRHLFKIVDALRCDEKLCHEHSCRELGRFALELP